MDQPDFAVIAGQAAFHAVDGGAIIFHAPSKRLFALNAVAAFVWASLAEGLDAAHIRRGLASTFDLAENRAEEWFELALTTFAGAWQREAEPLLPDEPTLRAGTQPHAGVEYKLFGSVVRIIAPDLAIAALEELLGSLRADTDATDPRAGSTRPDLLLRIEPVEEGYLISGFGASPATVAPESLLAAVEQAIVQAIVPETPHLVAFHAAMLERYGHAVLLPAPSGSGKTTLSAVLAARDWRYGSDELVLFDRDLRWRGLPFPPCIKAENFALMERWYPRLAEARPHERFARKVKFLPLHVDALTAPIASVVVPQYRRGAETSLVAVDRLAGLTDLLAQAVYIPAGFDDSAVADLLEWHRQSTYYRLCYGDPTQAAETLEKMLLSGLERHQR